MMNECPTLPAQSAGGWGFWLLEVLTSSPRRESMPTSLPQPPPRPSPAQSSSP